MKKRTKVLKAIWRISKYFQKVKFSEVFRTIILKNLTSDLNFSELS